jgi:hypothetical protein
MATAERQCAADPGFVRRSSADMARVKKKKKQTGTPWVTEVLPTTPSFESRA